MGRPQCMGSKSAEDQSRIGRGGAGPRSMAGCHFASCFRLGTMAFKRLARICPKTRSIAAGALIFQRPETDTDVLSDHAHEDQDVRRECPGGPHHRQCGPRWSCKHGRHSGRSNSLHLYSPAVSWPSILLRRGGGAPLLATLATLSRKRGCDTGQSAFRCLYSLSIHCHSKH